MALTLGAPMVLTLMSAKQTNSAYTYMAIFSIEKCMNMLKFTALGEALGLLTTVATSSHSAAGRLRYFAFVSGSSGANFFLSRNPQRSCYKIKIINIKGHSC